MNKFEVLSQLQNKYGISSDIAISYVQKYSKEIYFDCLKHFKENKYKYYLITFTIDPKKVNDYSNHDKQKTIELYIIKLIKCLGDNIYISKEHANSNVHWHVSLRTRKSIKHSKLRYYRQTIGNIDVSRSKLNSQEEGINYISKESIPTKIN